MIPAIIHQAIHGYRDGHRLLSSSTPLSAEATRAMLVLSDMSGPSMQPGFDEYLTGYPLPGSEYFVLAKTWYAPEMQRPGCVWTHSMLIPQEYISHVSTPRLLVSLRRPQLGGVESVGTAPLILDDSPPAVSKLEGFANKSIAAALVGAVLGQTRPVIVVVEHVNQLESLFLRLWDELWPAAKARFSFCSGALMPRLVAGALMDLQAVPRAIPSSQFRMSAGTALVVDPRTPEATEAWVEIILDGASRGNATFRSWMEAAAGGEASRDAAPSLMPIFSQWQATGWSARAFLASVATSPELESMRGRLVGMAFDRVGADEGTKGRRELLQELCGHHDPELSSITLHLENEVCLLFENSRTEACKLTIRLLGTELTKVGEQVLRAAIRLLTPSDLEAFGDAQAPFLSTIVSVNPALAAAAGLWKRAGLRSREILAQLDVSKLGQTERSAIVDAVLASGREAPIDALFRFAGDAAVPPVLVALLAGDLTLSTQWRSYVSGRSESVLVWLEGRRAVSSKELEVVSWFLSPTTEPERLAKAWQAGMEGSAGPITPRVAIFGLALAFSERSISPLLATCFQPTFDALASSLVDYEEWDWLREHAPAVSWWRDWDRCERVAAALAVRLERQKATPETFFSILRSRGAIRKVTSVLYDDRKTRPYLKSLRKEAEASQAIGTREQRDALVEGW